MISLRMPIFVLLSAAVMAVSTSAVFAGDASSVTEKDAFESAKELGTIDAWEAYLNNYPSGFRADLARAYVRKLGESSAAAPTHAAPPPPPALPPRVQARQATNPSMMRPSIGMLAMAPGARDVENRPVAARLPCAQRDVLRSQRSDSPARISFINFTSEPFEVFWLDENGREQLFGEIAPDRQADVETFVTQPWMLADLDGKCIALALPNPGPQVFVVGSKYSSASTGSRSGSSSSSSSSSSSTSRARERERAARREEASREQARRERERRDARREESRREAARRDREARREQERRDRERRESSNRKKSNSGSCGSGQIRIEGKCMSRSSAVSYCGPGFRPSRGKCVQRGGQVQQQPAPQPQQQQQQRCPKGLVWSAQEGCHEDD